MNIDLLLSTQDEIGLVSDQGFAHPIAGVMYDGQTGLLSLEFADADSFDLNIPVASEIGRDLARAHIVHVGIVERGIVADSRQVPLFLRNDPFGGGNFGSFAARPRQSVLAFDTFMKRASAGQPVHRDDVADEAHIGSVLGGLSSAVLQFAPHLSRQRALEAAPRAPAPSGPTLGPGGAGRAAAPRLQQPRTPKTPDEGE